jgi:hypothetical protein
MTPASPPTVRGFLISVGVSPEVRIDFQFNPKELTDRRALTYASVGAPGLLMPVRQYVQGGDRTISFSVEVDGRYPADTPIASDDSGGITPELNKYRAFVYPATSDWSSASGSSFVSLYDSTQQFVSPPQAIFGFGDIVVPCTVTEISITETLLDPNLSVLRAKVAVTLVERAPYGNEPTSPPPEGLS